MASTAVDVLTHPELLRSAKAALAAFRADNSFANPITPEVDVPLDMAAG